jgi:hypothetical protein
LLEGGDGGVFAGRIEGFAKQRYVSGRSIILEALAPDADTSMVLHSEINEAALIRP